MQGLIGKKIGMTRVFDKKTGNVVPVTIIQTGTNVVHQVKTVEKDGYAAAQLGFGSVSEKRVSKPRAGHMKKWGDTASKVIREFEVESSDAEIKSGQRIGVEMFENIKYVDVTGTSKGRGFAGVIKRYNFHRGRETHGCKHHRDRGSNGSNTYPARSFPGLRMAGRMGGQQCTIKRLKLVACDKEAGLLLIEGAVPGANKGIVFVNKTPD